MPTAIALPMSADTLAYYQREADRKAREAQVYGGNPELLKLRCFKYYHPDSGSFLTGPDGRAHWLGAKGSRVWAIAQRDRQTTMKAIAEEALCCVSTVSRTLTRLQSFGMLAVDVTRGRNGGVTIRLPQMVPAMRHYIAAAWKRIRSWINVASRSRGGEEGTDNTLTVKDATFTEEAAIERLGARVLAGEVSVESLSALNGRDQRLAEEEDRAHRRYAAWALEVIAERARLDREDPDWDFADLR